MAIFHFTVKIVGRSKGKSIISASAYLNGDVMKNEETRRIIYYTSKKEVVYTSLMMLKMHHLNGCMYQKKIKKGFSSLSVIREPMIKNLHWKSSKSHFRNRGYGMRY